MLNPNDEVERSVCRGAGFPTCCITDFPVGWAREDSGAQNLLPPAGWETRDTADLGVGATIPNSGFGLKPHSKLSAAIGRVDVSLTGPVRCDRRSVWSVLPWQLISAFLHSAALADYHLVTLFTRPFTDWPEFSNE